MQRLNLRISRYFCVFFHAASSAALRFAINRYSLTSLAFCLVARAFRAGAIFFLWLAEDGTNA